MAVAEPTMMAPVDDLDPVLRKLEEIAAAVKRPSGLPPWLIPLVMWSVLQLVGSIWWAATIQAKQDACLAGVDETKVRVNVLEMRANNSDASFGERVRAKVRETIDDLDLIRIRRQQEE